MRRKRSNRILIMVENNEVFQIVFKECDKIRSGQVRASTLFNYLRSGYLNPLESDLLDKISRALDPKQDDRFIDCGTFQKIGEEIVDIIENSSNEKNFEGVGYEEPQYDKSSFGLLDSALLNSTIGSLEGFGMDSASTCSSELRHDISVLRHQNHNLLKEKSALQKYNGELENSNIKIIAKKNYLEKKLSIAEENLHHHISKTNEELLSSENILDSSSLIQTSEHILVKKARYQKVLDENIKLREELSESQHLLTKNGETLKEQDNEINLLCSELRLAKSDLKKKKECLKAMEKTQERFAQTNESLTCQNQKLEFENEKLRGNITNYEEEIRNSSFPQIKQFLEEAEDISFENEDIYSIGFERHKFFRKEGLCPSNLTSTPFFGINRDRLSIGDEIIETGSTNLPIVDKSFFTTLNDEKKLSSDQCSSIDSDCFRPASSIRQSAFESSQVIAKEKMKKEEKGVQTLSFDVFNKSQVSKKTQTNFESIRNVKEIVNGIIGDSVMARDKRKIRSRSKITFKDHSNSAVFMKIGGYLIIFIVLFTFFGAVQINNETFYPVTWTPWFPKPIFIYKESLRHELDVW